MADDNWPPPPVDWLAVTINESKPVTKDEPAAAMNESKNTVCQSRNHSRAVH